MYQVQRMKETVHTNHAGLRTEVKNEGNEGKNMNGVELEGQLKAENQPASKCFCEFPHAKEAVYAVAFLRPNRRKTLKLVETLASQVT